MSIWSEVFTEPYVRQFTPDGDGYLYRRNQREAPVRVTAAERDAFVRAYVRAANWSTPLLMGSILVVALLGIVVSINLPDEPVIPLQIAGLVMVVVPYSWFIIHHWGAASRTVYGRPVVGERRTGEEWARLKLASLNYGWMALTALFCVWQLVHYYVRPTLFGGGWDLIRPVMGAGLLALIAVQSIRKYRAERAA